MTWHTSVPSLTAIIAHDAKTFSGTNLIDKTAGNRTLSLNGNYIDRIREGDKEYSAVIGIDRSMDYSSSISLPSGGCTIFALLRLRQRTLLINSTYSGGGAPYYLAIQPEIETPDTPPRVYGGNASVDGRAPPNVRGKISAYALTYTATATSVIQYVDGNQISFTANASSVPGLSTGINYPDWYLKSDLLCFGIFNGVATPAQLLTMQQAALSFMEESTLSSDVVFDETFDTQIPETFGPLLLSTAGTATAVYNSVDKCINVTSTGSSHNSYQLPGKFMSKGEIEADIEITGTRSGVVGLTFQGIGTPMRGITDSSSSPKTFSLFGDAQVSPAQAKFGGSSIFFDGSGDYIRTAYSDGFNFGSGDFTIETFVRLSSYPGVWHTIGSNLRDSPAKGWRLLLDPGGRPLFSAYWSSGGITNANAYVGTTGIALNTWTHLAVVRQGDSIKYYINGTLTYTHTLTAGSTVAPSDQPFDIGMEQAFTWSFHGYLDEYRITKGVSRYTANFSVPTQPYPENITADTNYNSVVVLLKTYSSYGSIQGLNVYSEIAAPSATGPVFGARYANGALPPVFTTIQQNYQTSSAFFNDVGQRKVIKLVFDLVPYSSNGWAALYIDSLKVLEFKPMYAYAGNFSIYFNNQSFKIHRVKQTQTTSYARSTAQSVLTENILNNSDGDTWESMGAATLLGSLIDDSVSYNNLSIAVKDTYFYSGKIEGTVKIKNTPENTPAQRRVFLMHELTKTIIQDTHSDPITGYYEFKHLPINTPYTILSYDNVNSVYPAVIASGILPDKMI